MRADVRTVMTPKKNETLSRVRSVRELSQLCVSLTSRDDTCPVGGRVAGGEGSASHGGARTTPPCESARTLVLNLRSSRSASSHFSRSVLGRPLLLLLPSVGALGSSAPSEARSADDPRDDLLESVPSASSASSSTAKMRGLLGARLRTVLQCARGAGDGTQ